MSQNKRVDLVLDVAGRCGEYCYSFALACDGEIRRPGAFKATFPHQLLGFKQRRWLFGAFEPPAARTTASLLPRLLDNQLPYVTVCLGAASILIVIVAGDRLS